MGATYQGMVIVERFRSGEVIRRACRSRWSEHAAPGPFDDVAWQRRVPRADGGQRVSTPPGEVTHVDANDLFGAFADLAVDEHDFHVAGSGVEDQRGYRISSGPRADRIRRDDSDIRTLPRGETADFILKADRPCADAGRQFE